MNNCFRQFNAKVLLFGEYSVLMGSSALSVPLSRFKAVLSFYNNRDENVDNENFRSSGQYLKKFLSFLENSVLKEQFKLKTFRDDLENGLYLNSTIPQSYGLGSSGAVVAAVFDRYYRKSDEEIFSNDFLKNLFSKMESFFHGNSSGMDPLSIYLSVPLYFSLKANIIPLDSKLSLSNNSFFLVDTGKKSSTSHLVDLFFRKMENKDFSEMIKNELLQSNDKASKAYLNNDSSSLKEAFYSISDFQFQYFKEMIPAGYHDIWQSGLKGDDFCLKLCGSGGGGYLLGFAHNIKNTEKFFSEKNLSILRWQ